MHASNANYSSIGIAAVLFSSETFYAYSNRIGGTLPSELGSLSLSELQLFANNFRGTIPEELFNNDGMTLLRLDFNSLSGTISPQIGDLVGLKQLWMNNNTFTGSLPATLARLSNMGKLFVACYYIAVLYSMLDDSLTSMPCPSLQLYATSKNCCRDASVEQQPVDGNYP